MLCSDREKYWCFSCCDPPLLCVLHPSLPLWVHGVKPIKAFVRGNNESKSSFKKGRIMLQSPDISACLLTPSLIGVWNIRSTEAVCMTYLVYTPLKHKIERFFLKKLEIYWWHSRRKFKTLMNVKCHRKICIEDINLHVHKTFALCWRQSQYFHFV